MSGEMSVTRSEWSGRVRVMWSGRIGVMWIGRVRVYVLVQSVSL